MSISSKKPSLSPNTADFARKIDRNQDGKVSQKEVQQMGENVEQGINIIPVEDYAALDTLEKLTKKGSVEYMSAQSGLSDNSHQAVEGDPGKIRPNSPNMRVKMSELTLGLRKLFSRSREGGPPIPVTHIDLVRTRKFIDAKGIDVIQGELKGLPPGIDPQILLRDFENLEKRFGITNDD